MTTTAELLELVQQKLAVIESQMQEYLLEQQTEGPALYVLDQLQSLKEDINCLLSQQ